VRYLLLRVKNASPSYFLKIVSTSVLGEDYEQNGVDKKRGRVRLNTLGGRKMGELYGGMEAEICRSLKSKRVQESRDREFNVLSLDLEKKSNGTMLKLCVFFSLQKRGRTSSI